MLSCEAIVLFSPSPSLALNQFILSVYRDAEIHNCHFQFIINTGNSYACKTGIYKMKKMLKLSVEMTTGFQLKWKGAKRQKPAVTFIPSLK